jgi:hypothetical protein
LHGEMEKTTEIGRQAAAQELMMMMDMVESANN